MITREHDDVEHIYDEVRAHEGYHTLVEQAEEASARSPRQHMQPVKIRT